MGKKKYEKKIRSKAYYKNQPLSTLWLIPLLFIVGIVPLIVFGKVLEIDGLEEEFWKGGSTHIDFFHYYKAVWFSVATYIGFIIVLVLYYLRRIELIKSKYYIPLGIYVVFVIFSAFNAADSTVALRGFMEMFQGVFVLIAYALIVFTTFNLVKEEKHIKAIVTAFVFVGGITAILGITQYFGFDFFHSMFARQLILPSELSDIADAIAFRFGAHTIYATMYNTNFVGSFAALLVPLSIVLFFYIKNRRYQIYAGFFVTAMVFVAFGSNSRAGMIGLFGGMIVMVILFKDVLLNNRAKVGIVLGIVVFVAVSLNIVSDGRTLGQISRLNIFREVERVEGRIEETAYFQDIIFDHYSIKILTDKETIEMRVEENSLRFFDSEGERLSIAQDDEDIYRFHDERYSEDFSVNMHQNNRFTLSIYQQDIGAVVTSDDLYLIGWRGEIINELKNPARLTFLDGYEQMFSSRIFIWSRSIPMMFDAFFIGEGPDMYPIAYPQDEYLGRLNGISSAIVDKPHNMYMQIGINTGVISLLALLSIFAFYIIDSFKIYFKKNYKTFIDYIGLGVLISIISYLGAGFFNDQILSVAPLFYLLLGLGLAINHKLNLTKNIEDQ